MNSCGLLPNVFFQSEEKETTNEGDNGSEETQTETSKGETSTNSNSKISKITLNPKLLNLNLDEEKQLDYIIFPSSASADAVLLFSSSNPEIASVTSSGVVKGKSKGQAIISVSAGTKTDSITVSVSNSYNINSVSITSKDQTLFINETFQVQAKYLPITNRITLSYYSENTSVASVSSSGLVTAIKEGKSQIYAFYDTNENNIFDSFEKGSSITITVKKETSYTSHQVKVLPFDFFNNASGDYLEAKKLFSYINVYELENHGRVPYIKADDFIQLLKTANSTNTKNLTSSLSGNVLTIKNNNDYSFAFDSSNNKITVKNFNTYQAYTTGTYTISGPNKTTIGGAPLEYTTTRYKVKDRGKSKILKTGSDVILDIGKYGLSFFHEKDFFIPLNTIIDLVCPYNKKWMFNGDCLFPNYNKSIYFPFIFSGDSGFTLDIARFSSNYSGSYEMNLTKAKSTETNVKYYYTGSGKFVDKSSTSYNSAYMKFYNDGTGKAFYKCLTNSPTDYSTSTPSSHPYAHMITNDTFTYEEVETGILKIKTNSDKYYYIDIDCPNSYANSTTIPIGLKEHNYNLLRYKFEEFYGLKEYMKISVDEFCKNNRTTIYLDTPVEKKNLNSNTLTDTFYNLFMNYDDLFTYEKTFVNFISSYANDAHTTIQYGPCIIGIDSYVRSNAHSLFNSPSCMTKINNAINTLTAARNKYFKVENSKPFYFFTNKTAVLCIDTFKLNQPLNNNYLSHYLIYQENKNYASFNTYSPMQSNVIMFYAFFADIYKNHPEIKNVVVDITLNTGGVVQGPLAGLAFYSDNTNYVMEDKLTKQITLYDYFFEYYRNDTEKNYIKNNTKLYVLTSNASFSAANIYAGLVKSNGVGKIIGNKTAGGACFTLMEVDALGTYFYRSGMGMFYGYDNSSNSSDIKSRMTDIEVGIEPDIVLNDYDTYYNHTKLDNYLNSLN